MPLGPFSPPPRRRYGVNTLLRFAKGMWYSSLGSAQCPPGAAKPVQLCRPLLLSQPLPRPYSPRFTSCSWMRVAHGRLKYGRQCKPCGVPLCLRQVGGCSWRVLDVAKRVHRECSDKLQMAAVKKVSSQLSHPMQSRASKFPCGPIAQQTLSRRDRGSQAAGGCFEACPQPNNSSSACWIGCFYRTMLGPHVGSQVSQPSEGMPRASVLAAWDAAFAPSSEGGCPSV